MYENTIFGVVVWGKPLFIFLEQYSSSTHNTPPKSFCFTNKDDFIQWYTKSPRMLNILASEAILLQVEEMHKQLQKGDSPSPTEDQDQTNH